MSADLLASWTKQAAEVLKQSAAAAGDPQRRPTKAEQPLFDGSHVNEDDLGAAELGAVCTAAHKHVSCGRNNCGDSEELAGLNGDIDVEEDAVDTTLEEA
ncbi:TPA: hypothetical protein ACH3X1_001583 [Trebouxia sp. C0004]